MGFSLRTNERADVTESSAPIYICTDACIDAFGFKKYEHFDNNHTDKDRE